MLPDDLPAQFVAVQKSIDRIVTDTAFVVGKVRHRIIGCAGEKKLTVVKSIDGHRDN
jgi:hypothetical protein